MLPSRNSVRLSEYWGEKKYVYWCTPGGNSCFSEVIADVFPPRGIQTAKASIQFNKTIELKKTKKASTCLSMEAAIVYLVSLHDFINVVRSKQ